MTPIDLFAVSTYWQNILTLPVMLGSYFIGSIPFGYFAGKMRGMDIRQHGSGNIGATNVFRVCGPTTGIIVFILDFAKGLLPVLLATWLGGALPVLAAISAILGHNYCCWLKFKGGKGVATSAGTLVGLLPWALLVGLGVWIISFAASRYVSLASILAALSLPITVAIMWPFKGNNIHWAHVVFAVLVAAMVVWRHRGNIQRLRAGTELRFRQKNPSTTPDL